MCKKYEKQSVFLELSSDVSCFCFIALFILSVITISIPCLALVIDYLWVISKLLKQHSFVHNFTNPEDNCHV